MVLSQGFFYCTVRFRGRLYPGKDPFPRQPSSVHNVPDGNVDPAALITGPDLCRI